VITTPYPAAAVVAPRIRDYFLRHLAAVPAGGGEGMAPVPDVAVLESLINAAFWTSLRREEGFVPKMSLAFVPLADNGYSMRFEQPMPLTPITMAKVAPVVESARHVVELTQPVVEPPQPVAEPDEPQPLPSAAPEPPPRARAKVEKSASEPARVAAPKEKPESKPTSASAPASPPASRPTRKAWSPFPELKQPVLPPNVR